MRPWTIRDPILSAIEAEGDGCPARPGSYVEAADRCPRHLSGAHAGVVSVRRAPGYEDEPGTQPRQVSAGAGVGVSPRPTLTADRNAAACSALTDWSS